MSGPRQDVLEVKEKVDRLLDQASRLSWNPYHWHGHFGYCGYRFEIMSECNESW